MRPWRHSFDIFFERNISAFVWEGKSTKHIVRLKVYYVVLRRSLLSHSYSSSLENSGVIRNGKEEFIVR